MAQSRQRQSTEDTMESTVETTESTVDVSTTPEGWEWENVETSTLIIFDTYGDVFIGKYEGEENFEKGPDSFERFNFRSADGELYAISKSTKLAQAMSKVDIGKWCRLTYVGDLPSNRRGHNPTKDIRVDVRK